jgi:hypothetical protein
MKVANTCREIYVLAHQLPKSALAIGGRVRSLRGQGFFYYERLDRIDKLLGELPTALAERANTYTKNGHTIVLPVGGVPDEFILKHFGRDIQFAITEFWEQNSPNGFE